MAFKLVLVIYSALAVGDPAAQENVTGSPDVRIQTQSNWQTNQDKEEFADLASCMVEADKIQADYDTVNAHGKWQHSVQCRSHGGLCEFLPSLYPGGVIPEGNLPDDLQARYDEECGEI